MPHYTTVQTAHCTTTQEEQVTRLLSQRSIDPYWGRELRRVDRPSARALLPLLDAANCIGFTPGPSMVRSGSLFDYVLAQKVRSGASL
jgi:hypothetical protein